MFGFDGSDDPSTARRPERRNTCQRAIRRAINDTSSNTGMTLTVAFDYGGRAELMAAVRTLRSTTGTVDADRLAAHLYDPELPDVDVLVRTSGEMRVSNFLLWQAAGAGHPFH